MHYTKLSLACLALSLGFSFPTAGREWSDTTGKYRIEADLIGYDDETVILQRQDGELGATPIEKLSDADREYLKTKEAEEVHDRNVNKEQTWTMRSGLKIQGRVVDYARRDITIQRRRGKIYVNDRLFENMPKIYQQMMPKIVDHFDKLPRPDQRGFETWVVRRRGEPKTFTVEGVILELENGDEYGVPFFFFSDEDLSMLQPGWDEWLAVHQDHDKRDDEAFRLQSLAAAYHRDKQMDRQIAIMNLNMQAIQAGLTSAWEVTLYPVGDNPNPPMWVVAPGRNSAQAKAWALQNNPGFVAGAIRRVSG